MHRKILVVDDNKINRETLKGTLGQEYEILEAENGQEALEILMRSYKVLSAVLLDISMPIMDGYEVLRRMQGNMALSQIPVIVVTGSTDETGREKALSLGANDFVTKPYNPRIIKHCLHNNISLRETASIINAIQRDHLTGLYTRDTFFEKAGELIKTHAPGYYTLCCFDIDNFKLINDQYGSDVGDQLLVEMAAAAKKAAAETNGIAGRVTADNFVALSPTEDAGDVFLKRLQAVKMPNRSQPSLPLSVGRYVVADLSLSPSAMYDRAYLAKQSVKGRYDEHLAYFDQSMLERLHKNQRLTSDMGRALTERQFEVWFQPQYNHVNGALIGAEALVRWRHPERGLIPPNDFIPVFEQNGFIYEMDKYVWEETCRFLRKACYEGHKPVPVSVNISRYDILRIDLIETMMGLVRKYDVSTELLRLEITESAFEKAPEQVAYVVRQFIDCGFVVEIDDFGSGYSSLNTLKDVPAQVMKLDMKFFNKSANSQRSGNIVSSVVRMAKWLGMSVIAEGVETLEQADYLKSIGCYYIQGYLYARPMPAREYEELCAKAEKEPGLSRLVTVENLDNNAFWDPNSIETLIFNSYVGGACIFECHNGKAELLRVNDRYIEELGLDEGEDGKLTTAINRLDDKNREIVMENVRKTIETNKESSFEVQGIFGDEKDKTPKYFLTTIRVIARSEDRYLLYCVIRNITTQRLAELKERNVTERLQAIMRHTDCGIIAVVLTQDEAVNYVFSNNRYYELLGYTREQFDREIKDPLKLVIPEDCDAILPKIKAMQNVGQAGTFDMRARRRDGKIIWLRDAITVIEFSDVPQPLQLSCFTDITEEKEKGQQLEYLNETMLNLMNRTPGAFVQMRLKPDGVLAAEYCNDGFFELVDMDREAARAVFADNVLNGVHPDDVETVKQTAEKMLTLGEVHNVRCRLRRGKKGYVWTLVSGQMTKDMNGEIILNAYYTDATEQTNAEGLQRELLDNLPYGAGLYEYDGKKMSVVHLNHRYWQFVNRDEKEFSNAAFMDSVHPDDRALIANEMKSALREKRDASCVLRILCGDGKYRPFYVVGSITKSADGKYLVYAAHTPISAQTVPVQEMLPAVAELNLMKARMEFVTNNIPGGIAVYEARRDALDKFWLAYFNDGFCNLFGYTREEYKKLSDKNPLCLVFKEDLPVATAQLKDVMAGGRTVDCVFRAAVKGGGMKWINFRGMTGEPDGDNVTINAVLLDVTAQQEALEQLRISEAENRFAAAQSGCFIGHFSVPDKTLTLIPEVARVFSIPEMLRDIPYGPVEDGIIAPESKETYIALYEDIVHGSKSGSSVFKKKMVNGWRWMKANYETGFSQSGEPISAVISFADVTEELEKEAVYKKWQQSIQVKPQDSYTLIRCNLSKNGGCDEPEGSLLSFDLGGGEKSFTQQKKVYAEKYVSEEDREKYLAFLNSDTLLANYYRGKRSDTLEFRERLPEGETRWLRLSADLVEYPNSADVEAYFMYENIDAAKLAQLQMKELAETDPLTGVLNRATFVAEVEKAIREAEPDACHAMLMLDVDGFKQVNDVFGHGAGDQVLVDMADGLRSVLRREDIVGRLGGDEFVVFLRDIPDDTVAADKSKQICAIARKAISVEVQISSSVGIAVSPRDGADFEALYKRADCALYYVKDCGKDNYAFYNEKMQDMQLGAKPEEEQPKSVKKHEKRRRMLIVDDSATDCELLANIFEGSFIVETVKDGNTALIRMRHYGSALSVVLLDLIMPGLDGYGVLAKMRGFSELQTVPVVVVSADERREACLDAIRAGATDFVTKPVDPELVRLRVESAISKASNERLRARNSYLELRNDDRIKYETALECTGVSIIEYDWLNGVFTYNSSVSRNLAGTYDNRKLWRILMSDMVTDAMTVQKMQRCVHSVAEQRDLTEGGVNAELETPSGKRHRFRMSVRKLTDEYGLTNKLIITLIDLDFEPPETAS